MHEAGRASGWTHDWHAQLTMLCDLNECHEAPPSWGARIRDVGVGTTMFFGMECGLGMDGMIGR
jgi:hypothetical protein